MQLLRIATAGSVDDGKSTLIGRLLHDTGCIYDDQLEALRRASGTEDLAAPNLALLTDGLRAERQQGITIDVAYRYFQTDKRKFIVADTPGHVQYTRNMVTGASTADVALLLVDVRKGLGEQTCRHAFVASLLGIRQLVLCVNKMDLVDFAEDRFRSIADELAAFVSRLDVVTLSSIPISALAGDNVVQRSERIPWYEGPTLLHHLESIYVGGTLNHVDARLPVQQVIRPGEGAGPSHRDFRGYAGRVAGGVFKPGDEVMILPSGFTTHIGDIHLGAAQVEEAFAPMSVTVTLTDELDVARGDLITKVGSPPDSSQDIDAMMCWFSEETRMEIGGRYLLRHTTREIPAKLVDVAYKVDVNTLHRVEDAAPLALNDIGRVRLRAAEPLHFDRYARNRAMGSLLLVDRFGGDTLAAGMIR